MGEESGDCHGGLVGKAPSLVLLGVEGVTAMIQHQLGEVGLDVGGLDAEVAKHGVGLPTAEELDGVRVHAGAEESGSAARAEGVCREQGGVDAGGVGEQVGGVTQAWVTLAGLTEYQQRWLGWAL